MHIPHPHDCPPSLIAGREVGAILYIEGDVLYAAMIDSIQSAQHQVDFESYLFADDDVGKRFADVLSVNFHLSIEKTGLFLPN